MQSDEKCVEGVPLKRRELLMMVAGAGLALVLPATALARGEKWVSIGKSAQFVKDTPLKVEMPGNAGVLWVTRTAKDKLTAVSAVCTHKGGIVNWDATSKKLVCPLHAAEFDFDGKNEKGTRKHPDEKLSGLAVIKVKESKGAVMIDTSTLTTARPKAEEKKESTIPPAKP